MSINNAKHVFNYGGDGMKLLRATAEGLPLFKEKLDICFYAQQRISEEQKEQLHPLFSNVYLNPATGFIGINASGKTSVLKVILLILGIMNNEPINHIDTRDILGDAKKTVLNIFFYSETNKEVCRLETVVAARKTKTEGIIYSIISERIWSKKTEEIIARKAMLDFDGKEPIMVRSGQEDFLSDDVSIMIALNKKTGEMEMRQVKTTRYPATLKEAKALIGANNKAKQKSKTTGITNKVPFKRALKEYTEESISELVNRIVDGQVESGAFKVCPITFRDIEIAKHVMIDRLKTIYHTRISYPSLVQSLQPIQ